MKTGTAAKGVEQFLTAAVQPYGTPKCVLNDNVPQFVSKFYECICILLPIHPILTPAYHLQTNGKATRLNRTTFIQIRHQISENQKDLAEYIEQLAYAYSMQAAPSTGTTPLDLALTRPPHGIVLAASSTALQQSAQKEPTMPELNEIIVSRLKRYLANARSTRTKAQQTYEMSFDTNFLVRMPIETGDEFSLSTRPATPYRMSRYPTQSYSRDRLAPSRY